MLGDGDEDSGDAVIAVMDSYDSGATAADVVATAVQVEERFDVDLVAHFGWRRDLL
jgi:hypothetical protein